MPRRRTILFSCLAAFAGAAFALLPHLAAPPSVAAPRALFPRQQQEVGFYEEAFAWAEAHPAPRAEAGAVIVNHHLLAKHLIARILQAVAVVPRRIIVISPDHFLRGPTDVTVAGADFDTPYGIAVSDDALVHALAAAAQVTVNNERMYGEHGIQGIMPLLKKQFPRATFATVMLKSEADVSAFSDALIAALRPDDLIVASLDFSHSLTEPATAFHDEMALSVLQAADADGAGQLDIDCRACVRALFAANSARGTQRFQLFDNTNAALLLGDAESQEGTSYVNGAFVAGAPEPDGNMTALLLPTREGTAFGPDERFFFGQDITLGRFGKDGERTVRGATARYAFDPTDDIVHFTCPNGAVASYDAGAKEAYGIGAASFWMIARPPLKVALAVTCRPREMIVRPFVLQPDLAAPEATRVYLRQHFSITDDSFVITAPR